MNAAHPTDPPPCRLGEPKPQSREGFTAPLALWRVAEAFMHILHALFGAPEHVAERHTLHFTAYTLLLSWLRAGEAMMRRLLLIEAAAYSKPNTRPLLRPSRKRVHKPMGFTPDAPEQWRVSFRCFASPTLRPSQGDAEGSESVSLSLSKAARPARKRVSREDRWCSSRWKPVRLRSAWPLAERYEALLRAFNDPAPYARRLARRLYATPHRVREVLRPSVEAEHRIESYLELCDIAETEALIFNST